MRDVAAPFDFALPHMALLRSVAEQLKLPLTVIARQAELGACSELPTTAMMSAIQAQSDVALRLVDSYLLGLQLAEEQTELALEPVSVAATLVDVAEDLRALAKLYQVQLEVVVDGKYAPVMAHARGFRAALLSLGYELIEAHAATNGPSTHERLAFAVHRTPHGVVAGLYGKFEALNAAQWRKSLELCGRARQAAPNLTAGSGAGLFVAETLFSAMDTRVRVGRFHKKIGLAATLQSSRQLQLV
ncbi:MAG TPA: hypothetical protein VIM53_03340 [Candidatus Saccharimonadales bacterium]